MHTSTKPAEPPAAICMTACLRSGGGCCWCCVVVVVIVMNCVGLMRIFFIARMCNYCLCFGKWLCSFKCKKIIRFRCNGIGKCPVGSPIDIGVFLLSYMALHIGL